MSSQSASNPFLDAFLGVESMFVVAIMDIEQVQVDVFAAFLDEPELHLGILVLGLEEVGCIKHIAFDIDLLLGGDVIAAINAFAGVLFVPKIPVCVFAAFFCQVIANENIVFIDKIDLLIHDLDQHNKPFG